MSSYLIPKSARNVRLQIFKGLGLAEAAIFLASALLVILIFQIADISRETDVILGVVLTMVILLLTIFLISPTFIANKKGYQSFNVIFNFWSSHKYFKKKTVKISKKDM